MKRLQNLDQGIGIQSEKRKNKRHSGTAIFARIRLTRKLQKIHLI